MIYNPIAGGQTAGREKQVRAAVEALRDSGLSAEPQPTRAAGEAERLARSAIAGGSRLILVCGGDGTIHQAVNAMAGSDAALGILPGGTANIAARELGLPLDPVRAARELHRWRPRRIALGQASWPASSAEAHPESAEHHRYFLCLAGIGFDAQVIHHLDSAPAGRRSVATYVAAGIRQFFRYSFPAFPCRIGGQEFAATFALAHRSQRYAGWFALAPGASLFAPSLTFCAFTSRHKWRYVFYASAVILRRHVKLSDVKFIRGDRMDCGASGTVVRFELDGELAGELPARFEIVPDALTLLAPARHG